MKGSRSTPRTTKSPSTGLPTAEAKIRIAEWLEDGTTAAQPPSTTRLRDWLFSRQRYWGEPFPIVYDAHGPRAVPESMLPVELPEITNFEPRILAEDDPAPPEPPLARADDWVRVTLDLGDGEQVYRRETNTMPQWAGSCWYYLRYLDPTNEDRLVDPAVERYWMGDGATIAKEGLVDLYVGGAEHAVLHLMYSRFWHKVLFDRGHVPTPEPFQRLVNQGTLQAAAEYLDDAQRIRAEASEVVERDGQWYFEGSLVTRRAGRMGKSRKNAVAPDDMYRDYGADTLRLYEMFMGPLDAARAWSTSDIAGVFKLLQRFWRNVVDEDTGESRTWSDAAAPTARPVGFLHRTIGAVRRRHDREARVQHGHRACSPRLQQPLDAAVVADTGAAPRGRGVDDPDAGPAHATRRRRGVGAARPRRLGHLRAVPDRRSGAARRRRGRGARSRSNGKVRGRVRVAADADVIAHEAVARADERIAALLDGADVVKVVVVPGRTVNFVVKA